MSIKENGTKFRNKERNSVYNSKDEGSFSSKGLVYSRRETGESYIPMELKGTQMSAISKKAYSTFRRLSTLKPVITIRERVFRLLCPMLALLVLFVFVSCAQPEANKKGNGLLVDSNIDVISARSVGIYDFEKNLKGVDFVFHNGDVVTPLGKEISDPNLFYIEYYEGESDHNCTFWIPAVIEKIFEEETGDTKAVANSYVWYLTQYQDKDIEEIRKGWVNALIPLLERKGETLPYPKQEDIGDRWKSYSEKGMEDFIPISSDGSGPELTGKPMNSFFFYEKNGKNILHTPCYLGKVYVAGGGKISLNDTKYGPDILDFNSQAFLWYAEKYYDLSAEDLLDIYKNGKLEELIEEMNTKYSYSQVQPEDVFWESKTSVVDNIDEFDDDKELYYYDVACYKSGCLVGKDGMVLTEDDRVYVMLYTFPNGDTYFMLLVPYEFHKKYGGVSGPNIWGCYGNELWDYLKDIGISEEEIEKRKESCSIPTSYLKTLLKERITK